MYTTIQNNKNPALEHNGRYYQTFMPLSKNELIKIHHMGCVGDTVLTDIQLEQGDFPTSFVEPAVTQRDLSGIFRDMRLLELELRDPASTFWGKIQQTNEGALTQFFKDKVKSAIAQTASEIRQEVRDAANSARVQVTADGVTVGSTKITGEQLASTISVSPKAIELIAPKIRVQSDMLVDGSVTSRKMAAGSVTAITLDAEAVTAEKVRFDDAFIKKMLANEAFIEQLTSKRIFSNRVESVISSSTFLEAYKGMIGGFQIGTHEKDSSVYWITGQNQFSVGMSNGSGQWSQTALWVNWGDNWGYPGNYAWYVKNNGKMYCYNTAEFWNTPVIHGNLRVTGHIYYNNENSGKTGHWIHSSKYSNFEPSNNYLYLYYSGSGYDWIPMNKEISDRRYKHNIEASTVSGIDVVESLKTYSYRKEYDGKIEDISCGIMAQDVQKHAPEAFFENPDGAYSYRTFELVPYLIKAIQELNQKIQKLEKTA